MYVLWFKSRKNFAQCQDEDRGSEELLTSDNLFQAHFEVRLSFHNAADVSTNGINEHHINIGFHQINDVWDETNILR